MLAVIVNNEYILLTFYIISKTILNTSPINRIHSNIGIMHNMSMIDNVNVNGYTFIETKLTRKI